MKKKISSFLIMLLILSSVFVPMLLATSDIFEPYTGITDPEKYYSVYLRPDGSMRTDSIRIPIIDKDLTGTNIGAVLFANISINKNENINEAILSLYFLGDLEASSENLTIRVYGLLDAFFPSTTLAGLDRENPRTVAYTDLDVTGITSEQWVNVTVTNIVDEITSLYGWTSGYSLGFIIEGYEPTTEGAASRSYQSNIGANYPRIYITHGEPIAPNTYEYENYTITYTPPGTGTPLTAFVASNGGGNNVSLWVLNSTESAQSSNWTEYPYPYLEIGANWHTDYDRGVVYNGSLYLYGLDTDGTFSTHIYKAPLTNLSNLTKVANMQSIVDSADYYSMTFDEDRERIYTVTSETGGLFFKIYFLANNSVSAETLVYAGYSTGSQAGCDALVDQHGTIFIVGGFPMEGDSTTRTRVAYSTNEGATWTTQRLSPIGVYAGYPMLNEIGDFVVCSYMYNSPLSIVYRYINTTSLSGWASVQTWSTVSTLTYGDGFAIKNYYDNPNPYRDIIVRTGQRTGTDNRIGAAIISLNSSGYITASSIPAYASLGNQTGVDKWFNTHVIVDNDIYSIYADTGSPYYNYWASPAFGTNNTISFYNTNPTPPAGIHLAIDSRLYGFSSIIIPDSQFDSSGGGWVVIPPPGADPPDPNCLAAAVTLEDVMACIDKVKPVSGDDPSPPGWDETGYFTRGKIKLYFLFMGLGFVFLPLYFIVNASGYDKIRFVWLMLLSWVIGLALLMSVGRI